MTANPGTWPAEHSVHDRPSVDEILEAVAEHLGADDAGVAEAGRRYHRLVAASLLSIVRRELAAGEDHQRLLAAERDRLNVDHLASLAPELRSGARHPADGALRASLRRVVEAKVAVARPDHLERRIPPFDPVTDS